jgi:hypothetical protein
MARFERSQRPAAGGPPTPDGRPTVKMRLGADGAWKPVEEEHPKVAETEQRPLPPQADDPRSALERNLPPYAAGG